ncbi:MAG: T9SS type A sorting domain-containing protein, partial [Sphingobacteriales bacterium]
MVIRKKKAFLVAVFAFGCFTAQAQFTKPENKSTVEPVSIGKKSEIKTSPLLGEINLMDSTPYYSPVLMRTGIYHGEEESTGGNIIPKEKLPPYIEDGKNASREKSAVEVPVVFRSYTGYSDNNYTPPDNTIAVNNEGTVISAMNSNFRILSNTGKLLKTNTFFDIFKTEFPAFKQTFYDPKLIYDSGSDRFIMVVLHGNKSDSSKIMIMFSKTKNPQDGWNFYALNGDVLGKTQWTDYPNIGVSNNELYITGNLFSNEQYYQEPFILQINKNDGYDGKSLTFQAWNDIRDRTGNPSFTLVPVPYGQQGNYGPGIYLVSNEQFNSNTMNVFHITDDMSATNERLQRTTITNPFSYSVPQYTSQKGSTDLLNSGDTRIKHAFYLDKTIHYVYTTLNSNNNSSIVYCRMDVEKMQQDYRAFGVSGQNYNYPSIASLGSNDKDKSVLIGFLSSSKDIFPEIRAVHCDNNFEFSTSIQVQTGNSSVNILKDNVERWGDYTGMARRFSTTAVLFSGCYGNLNRWTTRIAEIGLNSNKVGIQETSTEPTDINVYPNPAFNLFSVDFNIKEKSQISIQLYDIQGRLVETLYSGMEPAGKRNFSFNSAALHRRSAPRRIHRRK